MLPSGFDVLKSRERRVKPRIALSAWSARALRDWRPLAPTSQRGNDQKTATSETPALRVTSVTSAAKIALASSRVALRSEAFSRFDAPTQHTGKSPTSQIAGERASRTPSAPLAQLELRANGLTPRIERQAPPTARREVPRLHEQSASSEQPRLRAANEVAAETTRAEAPELASRPDARPKRLWQGWEGDALALEQWLQATR